MINSLLKHAVRLYQRFLSPYKGYSCAHRAWYGGDSCSDAVLRILESDGLIGGWQRIRSRFYACRLAAARLPAGQRVDLDCGVAGCLDFGGLDGCFSGPETTGSGKASAGRSGCAAPVIEMLFEFRRKSWKVRLSVLFSVSALAFAAGYYLYGSRIESVEIKLINSDAEDRDRKLALMANSELPDYQLIWEIDGQKYKSGVLLDSSAKDWLKIDIHPPFHISELDSLEIVNKQLLTSKTLDRLIKPDIGTEGTHYRLRYHRRWAW